MQGPARVNDFASVRCFVSWQQKSLPQKARPPKAIPRSTEMVRELTRRTCGVIVEKMAKQLDRHFQEWQGYFGYYQTPSVLRDNDCWRRRGLRAFLWKQWNAVRFAGGFPAK